jgi:uncharacterized protein
VIRVTADSNIYISALQFGGNPQRLLELAIKGEVELAISPAILEELVTVFSGKFKLSGDDIARSMRYVAACTKQVSPTETIDAVRGDPDDNRILECAVAAGSEIIVTGDSHLLQLGSFRGMNIEKAADFLVRFEGEGQ